MIAKSRRCVNDGLTLSIPELAFWVVALQHTNLPNSTLRHQGRCNSERSVVNSKQTEAPFTA